MSAITISATPMMTDHSVELSEVVVVVVDVDCE
jgi:hypothetical protein